MLDEPLVFIMRPDPNPDEIPLVFYGQGSMMRPGPHGPQLADLFEVQRRVCGIFFQEVEVVAGHSLDSFRKARIASPETGRRAMLHRS